jgi:hypothetical protein
LIPGSFPPPVTSPGTFSPPRRASENHVISKELTEWAGYRPCRLRPILPLSLRPFSPQAGNCANLGLSLALSENQAIRAGAIRRSSKVRLGLGRSRKCSLASQGLLKSASTARHKWSASCPSCCIDLNGADNQQEARLNCWDFRCKSREAANLGHLHQLPTR